MGGCYRKTKLAIDSIRDLASKIVTRAPIQETSCHQLNLKQCCVLDNSLKNPISRFSISSLIGGSRPVFQSGVKQMSYYNNKNGFVGQGRRFYYVDRSRVHHFKPRGPKKWLQNPRMVMVVVIVSTGVGITVYFGNLETIPYTKRKHFVLLSTSLEKRMGESQFEELKKSFRGKILPAIHPDSVRVRLISKDIIEALQRGLKNHNEWGALGYASESTAQGGGNAEEVIMAMSEDGKVNDGSWDRQDEILDDKWVQQSRKKGEDRGSIPTTQHLDSFEWEVIVVNHSLVNAFCLPGGKIVVFTGLLEHFRTDTELATIIGHEVAHAVARHAAEQITKNMWFTILQIVLLQFVSMPDLVNMMSQLLLRLPFSRRMEMEADYIGLLLTASAGYDPRVAPKVYQKLGEIDGGMAMADYLSTHPSGKKRAQVLSQAKVMEEAFSIYQQVREGRGVEGFL